MHPSELSPDTVPTDLLIRRCLDGDQQAWNEIVSRHWRKVFNIAYKFVGKSDKAEDLTQDIFLKIYKSLDTFDRRANFQTWLFSISRNLCIDHYRTIRREREVIDHRVDTTEVWHADTRRNAYGDLEHKERVELLRSALKQLAPTLRKAVIMRDLREMTYHEIAKALNVPEGTIKSRINRGRTELTRQLEQLRAQQDTHLKQKTLAQAKSSTSILEPENESDDRNI